MTFIHLYMLGGALLVGVPVLLHLIMRQKPKQLAFPAFRFLRQKLLVNRRKLRLQNLLLLLLRMLLILLLCLALARPRVQSGKIPFTADQEVTAVFVFDTRPSMEYGVGTQTRLEEAKARARELLSETAAGSSIAILDSSEEPLPADEENREWLGVAAARTRVDNLRIRPGNWPLNRQLKHACDLLEKRGQNADTQPRFLYVFSDRTSASWDGKAVADVKVPAGVTVLYVDVGTDTPRDVSIDNLVLDPPVVAPGQPLRILATVRATGEVSGETEVQCQFEGENQPDRQVVKLKKDDPQVVVFEKVAPQLANGHAQTTQQLTVRLGTNDALPSNNARYATFAIRNKRKVLTLVSNKAEQGELTRAWRIALDNAPGMFEADVRRLEDAEKLTTNELKAYKIVCLFETGNPSELWPRLGEYVNNGGSLLIIPGGRELQKEREDFNTGGAKVLPATLKELIEVPDNDPGKPWAGYPTSHPITAALDKWSKTVDPDFKRPDLLPKANGYWAVEPMDEKTTKLAIYADADDKNKEPRPALLERAVGAGKVMQFTVPLDGGLMEGNRRWHNYWTDSSFGFVLVDLVCRYLAGEGTAQELNFLCRERFTLPLPAGAPPFRLFGPGLSESESTLAPTADQASLEIPPTLEAGNFFIRGGKDERNAAAFSMNIREEEFRLERVPVEEIEAVLGQDVVLPIERTSNLAEILATRWSQVHELLPYLMILLLLLMPIESVLANLFSRRQKGA
jgi:Aerotolerance regulator N-terminal